MLNHIGFVAECTADNVFLVKDGIVTTPPSEAGILEGITRGVVMKLCGELGIECREAEPGSARPVRGRRVLLDGHRRGGDRRVDIDGRPMGDGSSRGRDEATERGVSRLCEAWSGGLNIAEPGAERLNRTSSPARTNAMAIGRPTWRPPVPGRGAGLRTRTKEKTDEPERLPTRSSATWSLKPKTMSARPTVATRRPARVSASVSRTSRTTLTTCEGSSWSPQRGVVAFARKTRTRLSAREAGPLIRRVDLLFCRFPFIPASADAAHRTLRPIANRPVAVAFDLEAVRRVQPATRGHGTPRRHRLARRRQDPRPKRRHRRRVLGRRAYPRPASAARRHHARSRGPGQQLPHRHLRRMGRLHRLRRTRRRQVPHRRRARADALHPVRTHRPPTPTSQGKVQGMVDGNIAFEATIIGTRMCRVPTAPPFRPSALAQDDGVRATPAPSPLQALDMRFELFDRGQRVENVASPSSAFLPIIRSAAVLTAGLAFPMAMPRPALFDHRAGRSCRRRSR